MPKSLLLLFLSFVSLILSLLQLRSQKVGGCLITFTIRSLDRDWNQVDVRELTYNSFQQFSIDSSHRLIIFIQNLISEKFTSYFFCFRSLTMASCAELNHERLETNNIESQNIFTSSSEFPSSRSTSNDKTRSGDSFRGLPKPNMIQAIASYIGFLRPYHGPLDKP